MGKRLEQTFLQRKYTNGQQAYKKTHYVGFLFGEKKMF